MTNEIEKLKRPVLMKSKLVLWVTEETAAKLEAHLAGQQAHTFIRVTEIGITINSAEVEGVYTPEQYDDLMRIKRGQWQCSWKKWHDRKEDCECAKEHWREEQQERGRIESRRDGAMEMHRNGVFKSLDKEEMAVLAFRIGINGEGCHTKQEIVTKFGMDMERVVAILTRASALAKEWEETNKSK